MLVELAQERWEQHSSARKAELQPAVETPLEQIPGAAPLESSEAALSEAACRQLKAH